MEQDKRILINHAMEKAFEAISSAESNFQNKFYSTCQNRLYYAVFYAVTALAYKNDFFTSKHAQLMGWFNKKFIYTDKTFDEKMFQIYKEAFTNRQKSDYDFLYQPDATEVSASFEEIKYFVKKIKNYLDNF